MQRGLARRAREDDRFPPSKWGKDRTVSDRKDLDPEDQVLAPRVAPNRGKTPVRPSVQNLSDDDSSDDECQVLEVIEARPLRYSFPVSTPPAASDAPAEGAEPDTAGGPRRSRVKQGASRTRGQPQAKRQKLVTARPPRKSRPSFQG